MEKERCKGSDKYLIMYDLRILFKVILCVLTLLTIAKDQDMTPQLMLVLRSSLRRRQSRA
jgi:hypothetical protein